MRNLRLKEFYSVWLALVLLAATGCQWPNHDGTVVDDPLSDLNGIISLSVSEGSLSPAFSLAITAYDVEVANEVDTIQVTATVEVSSVSLQINGAATASGAASSPISLNVGANAITVTATSESGISRTYTITVTRAVATEISQDASLNDLSISVGALTPSFAADILSYSVTVDNSTSGISLTPTTANNNATVAINGVAVASGTASNDIALSEGGTTDINIVVTAEDGVTVLTYMIAVTRQASLSNDASLSGLSLSVGSISPAFDGNVLDYVTSVAFASDTITVTAALSDTNASVTVNGVTTASGVASSAINLNEGDNTIPVIVLAEDGTTMQTYSIIVTRLGLANIGQDGYIKASNTGSGDFFGEQVAIFGDTLVVGAKAEESGVQGSQSDNSLQGAGAAYVYTKNAQGDWGQQAYLKASNFIQEGINGVNFEFGTSVALGQDTLVVGAPGENSLSTGVNGDQINTFPVGSVGAAYVFVRSGNSWTQQAYIKASNAGVGDDFGITVAISSDGNTLAVGASNEHSLSPGINGDETDSSGGAIGAVYVFTRTGTTWTQQAYVKPSMTLSAPYYFGASLALSEDGNILAVAAPYEGGGSTGVNGDQNYNSSFYNSGAVYVYSRTDTTWSQQAYVKASNTEKSDFFGQSVALSGNTLAVSSLSEDSTAVGINGDQSNGSATYGSDYNSGAVYVFERDLNSVWSQQAYVKASNSQQGALFGHVSLTNNGDSMLIGAYQNSSPSTGVDGDQSLCCGGSSSGAGYLYTRDAGSVWSQQHFIKASNTGFTDNFGKSVSIEAGGNIAIGAFREDSNATGVDGDQGDDSALDSGAVYVFKTDGL